MGRVSEGDGTGVKSRRIVMIAQPMDRLDRSGDDRSSVAIITRQLALRLAQRNDVRIFARRDPGQPREEIDARGIRIRRVRASNRILHEGLLRWSGAFGTGRPYFSSQLFYRGYFLRVARDLRSLRPEIVHFHNLLQHAPIFRSLLPHARLVVHMHGDSLPQLGLDIVKRQLNTIDLVVGVSDFVTDGIRRRYPEFADRCATVHNGVDVDRFRPNENSVSSCEKRAKRLLYVGRISPEKGIHVLFEAFERVLETHPDTELELIGTEGQLPSIYLTVSGDGRLPASLAPFYGNGLLERFRMQILRGKGSYISHLFARLGARARQKVHWRGTVSVSELQEAYRSADIFVFPSLWNEAFGMPVVEAMASGLPSVVSRSGPMPEIVGQGACGLIVDRDDPVALAMSIARLLEDAKLARALGREGRRRAVRWFLWDHVAGELESLYERICS